MDRVEADFSSSVVQSENLLEKVGSEGAEVHRIDVERMDSEARQWQNRINSIEVKPADNRITQENFNAFTASITNLGERYKNVINKLNNIGSLK